MTGVKRIAMIAGLAALAAVSCGGGRTRGPDAAPAAIVLPASAKRYPATRYLPAKPTYAIAARTVRDAQRSVADAIDGVGPTFSVDSAAVGRELMAMFAIDPLDLDALEDIGIDLAGGIAIFSESVNPTIVVRVKSPAQLQGWVETLRGRGMATTSVVVDGAEIFSTDAGRAGKPELSVSWTIVDDWCWVHFHLPGVPDDGTRWFSASRKPTGAAWAADWDHAYRSAGNDPSFVGFFDLPRVLATILPKAPDALACAKLVDPIRRVALAIDGDGKRVDARLAFDIGTASSTIAKALAPVPEGWTAAARGAAIAVQWNADLGAFRDWFAPCSKLLGWDLGSLQVYGVRSGRAMLHELDLDEPSGRGAIALELAHRRYFASQLDQIPLRSRLESRRTFGPHDGKRLSIPFGPELDYVLTDQLALAAMGSNLLAQVVGTGKLAPGPILALHVAPHAWTEDTWRSALKLVGNDHLFGERFLKLLLRWREGHFMLALDGTRVVLTANGTRL